MGVQTLSVVAAGTSVLQTNAFDSENMSLPLMLTHAAKTSRLLGAQAPSNILRWLTTENLTSNLHHDGVAPDSFASNEHLASLFSVLSTNQDRRGREFVSTIEGRVHPIYGVQWHPERPIFEWGADEGGINHSAHAIEAMQYFANFFISEARKNSHSFPSQREEEAALIYNYMPQGRSSYQ
ncbi:gghA, partial [Symbiodinium pilosum]